MQSVKLRGEMLLLQAAGIPRTRSCGISSSCRSTGSDLAQIEHNIRPQTVYGSCFMATMAAGRCSAPAIYGANVPCCVKV